MPPTRLRFACAFVFALALSISAHAQSLENYEPRSTLTQDVAAYDVELTPGYAEQRPRLLFFAKDRAALQQRAKDFPELWSAVIAHARWMERSPMDQEMIRTGAKYWRAEFMQSGALAWFITGNEAYRDGAIEWMKAFCDVDIWGTGFRENRDLPASWYLYHIALAYDILADEMAPEDRAAIREGLVQHAKVIYEEYAENPSNKIRYDQNHTYIPMTALTAAALALYGEVDAAEDWLDVAAAVLRRSRHVQSEDGYYYEGFGYWAYAMHWQVRAAELMARATGEPWFDLSAIRDTWKTALYLSLPGAPGCFDVGDTGSGSQDGKRSQISVNNHTMMWAIASATGSRESQAAGNFYQERKADLDYPAAAFLWFDPAIEPAPFNEMPPYQYFPDHGVVSWRSGWGDDATCVLFRCGPPLGHAATDKLKQLDDWLMNCGHVHPDIGSFWLYAKGEYLAVDTGYTARKWTDDHNTLLIDGKGQGADGSYWNERGVDYELFDEAKIDAVELTDEYFYVSGEFGSVYTPQVEGVHLRRTLVGAKDWVLVFDEMQSDEPHTLTWICHADAPFEKSGEASYIAKLPKASLRVFPLSPDAGLAELSWRATMQPTAVEAGRGPQNPIPAQRGHELLLTMSEPRKQALLPTLLLPMAEGEPMPTLAFRWKDRSTYTLSISGTKKPSQRVEIRLNPPAGQPHVKFQ